jgi:hypothetical protein
MMPLWTLDPTSTRSTATFFSLSFDTGTAFQFQFQFQFQLFQQVVPSSSNSLSHDFHFLLSCLFDCIQLSQ